jgi:hypothetical protein
MKKLFLFLLLATSLFGQEIKYYTVEIDSGVAVSDSVDLGAIQSEGSKLIAIVGDTAWTTANLTFLSWTPLTTANGMWSDLYEKDGTALAYTFTDSVYVLAKPIDFAGVRYLKIRSGTNTVPVKQTTTSATYPRKIRLVIREY